MAWQKESTELPVPTMVIAPARPKLKREAAFIPPLENGEMLTLSEFLYRYEDMHDVKKAELIQGITYMPSPVRIDLHARPDGIIHTWLGTFAYEHGYEMFPNATLLLDSENSFQPDAILCSPPRDRGRVWMNKKGYLCGAPELVVEVAASSASIDLRDKLRVYRRVGVREYLVWRTREKALDWFVLEDETYVNQSTGRETKLKSKVFPGLVLDVKALLAMDGAKVLAGLRKG